MKIRITSKAIERAETRLANSRKHLANARKSLDDRAKWLDDFEGGKFDGAALQSLQSALDRAKEYERSALDEFSRLNHRAPVNEKLANINGKAAAHTITTYVEVRAIADRAEKRLSELPVKERAGASVTYHPEGPSANAYKYKAISTQITLTRTSTGWWLTNVERTWIYPRGAERFDLYVTAHQASELMRRAVADLVVQDAHEIAA